LKLIDLGFDSSSSEHLYSIEWDASSVKFSVDGAVVREKALTRALAPLKVAISVWTVSSSSTSSSSSSSSSIIFL